MDLQDAKRLADELRPVWPDKAAAIDKAIAAANPADGLNITVGIRYRLEKFEGEIAPGKQPYETIEGRG